MLPVHGVNLVQGGDTGTGTVDGFSVENVRVISDSTDVTLGRSQRADSQRNVSRSKLRGRYGTFSIVYSDFTGRGMQPPFSVRATFNGNRSLHCP
jgi:hypothetical protein